MTTLSKQLRTQLENSVKAARDVAERAAQAALAQLAVGDARGPDYQSELQKVLRRRLRAHGRALGDVKLSDDTQNTQHLVWEAAYEHWHRMLFARFLADNGLLMWEHGAAVSLDDCRDMVDNYPDMAMNAKTHWELAGKLAARMLPQVFKPNNPVFELSFAPEYQRELEKLLAALPNEAFKASDSLGWVYQFWQSKRKDEVNASEVKIGADELPAVTQLFTEPYMVEFLLHNSLGAWWHTRHPGKPCPVELTYLRMQDDGTPAAGKFEGWPATLAEFKLLDPCCGSGHFLVAAFLLLVPMRIAAEGLSAMDAVDLVLQDNLHGLEIDPRCVEIAVFALALTAWRFPDEGGSPLGVRTDMPAPNIACCGLTVAARAEDWEALVPDNIVNASLVRQELRLLHASFAQAPLLGSLLDLSNSLKDDLATASFDTLKGLVDQALASEEPRTLWGDTQDVSDDAVELALSAKGLMEAARILNGRFNLIITNVPYRAGVDLHGELRAYIERHFSDGKTNLASAFLLRCLELSLKNGGVVNLVLPQDWLVQPTYDKLRRSLVSQVKIDYICRLGPGAFREITGEVVNVLLLSLTNQIPNEGHVYQALDCGRKINYDDKAKLLLSGNFCHVSQKSVLKSPGFSIFLANLNEEIEFLGKYASSVQGIKSGDDKRLTRFFWEVSTSEERWIPLQGTVVSTQLFSGLESVIDWTQDGALLARKQGLKAWGRRGIIVSQMSALPCALYAGGAFDSNVTVIFPRLSSDTSALLNFAFSGELSRLVREFDQSIKPTNSSFEKVKFSKEEWKQGSFSHDNSFPSPYSADPTQRIFHGHPQLSTYPLQVAVARLLGYTWPAESDDEMELSDEARKWVARCQSLDSHVDDDGIACLSAVRGEKSAHERLLAILIDSWETVEPGSWKASMLDKLLADADCAGKGLDVWLREKFFEQHVKRFRHRPFIWHVWDGLNDGFGALVNYHLLDAKNLERLIHTYLGDWIRNQEAGVTNGVDGAELRLAAAKQLKSRLEAILEGDAPHDIFVRWKPLVQQSIGWNPDFNDGVRMNIRPFMTAEVLRHNKAPKVNITWDRDLGKDVLSAPWFHQFAGDRINDHHLSLTEKRISRQAKGGV